MRTKTMRDVESMLGNNGYDYSEFTGCFDIAARRQLPTENILLLKVLENVDSFMEDHANNLSTVCFLYKSEIKSILSI